MYCTSDEPVAVGSIRIFVLLLERFEWMGSPDIIAARPSYSDRILPTIKITKCDD
ncbi:MAG: hypothetical protein HKN43_04760 [Rhodothermales bacterium]|nr:hypothetical protein [Rhodothermales bacterium]